MISAFVVADQRFGRTAILMGTKNGVPHREEDVNVCEDCYAVLKQKVKTRSRLSD